MVTTPRRKKPRASIGSCSSGTRKITDYFGRISQTPDSSFDHSTVFATPRGSTQSSSTPDSYHTAPTSVDSAPRNHTPIVHGHPEPIFPDPSPPPAIEVSSTDSTEAALDCFGACSRKEGDSADEVKIVSMKGVIELDQEDDGVETDQQIREVDQSATSNDSTPARTSTPCAETAAMIGPAIEPESHVDSLVEDVEIIDLPPTPPKESNDKPIWPSSPAEVIIRPMEPKSHLDSLVEDAETIDLPPTPQSRGASMEENQVDEGSTHYDHDPSPCDHDPLDSALTVSPLDQGNAATGEELDQMDGDSHLDQEMNDVTPESRESLWERFYSEMDKKCDQEMKTGNDAEGVAGGQRYHKNFNGQVAAEDDACYDPAGGMDDLVFAPLPSSSASIAPESNDNQESLTETIPSSLSMSLCDLIRNSPDTYLAATLLKLLEVRHPSRQPVMVPDASFRQVLIRLMTYGPEDDNKLKTPFPDPYRMEQVQAYLHRLFRENDVAVATCILRDFCDTAPSSYVEDCLNQIRTAPYYTLPGDQHPTQPLTEASCRRLFLSLQAKTHCAWLLRTLVYFQLGAYLQQDWCSPDTAAAVSHLPLINGICRHALHGAKGPRYMFEKSIQATIALYVKLCPLEFGDEYLSLSGHCDRPLLEARQDLDVQGEALLTILVNIVGMLGWLYGTSVCCGRSDAAQSVADFMVQVVDREIQCIREESNAEENSVEWDPKGTCEKVLKVKFVCSLQKSFIPQVRPKLANAWGVAYEFNMACAKCW
jgi:hypothetical protein